MIIVFTSNEKGALVQMAIKVTEVIKELGLPVKCYIPNNASTSIPLDIEASIVRYSKTKSPNPYNIGAITVARKILNENAKLVFAVDNGTFTSQIGIILGRKVPMGLVMHDAGTSHSSYKNGIRQMLKKRIEKLTSEVCNNRIDWIITCSQSSQDTYNKLYPKHKDKNLLLPLGPHMPDGNLVPVEVNDCDDYLLFFGHIDRYKGLINLLRAFSKWDGKRKLVVAGSGQLQPEESEIAQNDDRVVLINRFIKDEEMKYLFLHSRAIVLPYIEATQSGVLPIAYMCSKPVICSNVIGISQFVNNNETGYICSNDFDYIKAFSLIESNDTISFLAKQARLYYEAHLDWVKNIKMLLQQIGIK